MSPQDIYRAACRVAMRLVVILFAESRELQLKIGYRDVARSTDVRSFIGAVLPSFSGGNKVPILHLDDSTIDPTVNAMALLNSFVFDWLVRQRLGAATLELIERRAANGEDYFGILADRFTRELLGDDGYATVLLEIRSRNVADEDTYWKTVNALRDGDDLDENTYGQLLDKLHARGLVDDMGYRHRRGRNPPAPAAEPLLRVAEPLTDYRVATPAQDRQTDLFK